MTEKDPNAMRRKWQPTRRRLLAGLGGLSLAATAGCLDVVGLGSKPDIHLRATRTSGDATDVKCRLDESVVAKHPKLERVLTQAQGNDPGEWAKLGIDERTAESIESDLRSHCEQTRGIYRYQGQWFFISMRFTSAKAHEKHEQGHTHAGDETEHTHGSETSDHHDEEATGHHDGKTTDHHG